LLRCRVFPAESFAGGTGLCHDLAAGQAGSPERLTPTWSRTAWAWRADAAPRPQCAQQRAKVSRGLVVEEILQEAQRGDYDLVVIGAYREQGWQRILLEDLAHRIFAGLDRSVLVVR